MPNGSITKLGDLNVLKEISDECGQNHNKSESISLMHPAFQNVLHKRKYYGGHSIDSIGAFDKNIGDRDVRNCNNLMTNVMQAEFHKQATDHLKSRKNEFENAELSQDSSGSEEIDLTSNGCIDFSNNNNDTNRKSDKCAMNKF